MDFVVFYWKISTKPRCLRAVVFWIHGLLECQHTCLNRLKIQVFQDEVPTALLSQKSLDPPRSFHYKMLRVRVSRKLFFLMELKSQQNDMKCRPLTLLLNTMGDIFSWHAILHWQVTSDEQMSKEWPFSLLNDDQMSNCLGFEHCPMQVNFFVI